MAASQLVPSYCGNYISLVAGWAKWFVFRAMTRPSPKAFSAIINVREVFLWYTSVKDLIFSSAQYSFPASHLPVFSLYLASCAPGLSIYYPKYPLSCLLINGFLPLKIRLSDLIGASIIVKNNLCLNYNYIYEYFGIFIVK